MQQPNSARRRTAFVTGAAQGIGAGIALGLARDGYDVAVSSRTVDRLTEVTAQISAAGARALPVALEVRDPDSVARAMNEVTAAFGELDLLVNNAGVTLRKTVLEITPAEWATVMDTNLAGTFFMSQQMGRHLMDIGRPGCIISMASTHGVVAMAGRAAYGTSKGAIIHMTRMLAIEWAQHGIRVNALAPGTVLTAARAALPVDPGYREAMRARIPLKRECTTEEVAAAVCYLASPQAAYITGQTLLLDGGLTSY